MAGWHHWLGHEFEWTPRVGDGQGGLACCDSWGHRVGHDWATELNWIFTECLLYIRYSFKHFTWINIFHGLTHLILITASQVRCYYFRFSKWDNRGTDVKEHLRVTELISGRTNLDLNPGRLAPESVVLSPKPLCPIGDSEILKKKKISYPWWLR